MMSEVRKANPLAAKPKSSVMWDGAGQSQREGTHHSTHHDHWFVSFVYLKLNERNEDRFI